MPGWWNLYQKTYLQWKRKKQDFQIPLNEIDWSELHEASTTNNAFDFFHGKLGELFIKYFP